MHEMHILGYQGQKFFVHFACKISPEKNPICNPALSGASQSFSLLVFCEECKRLEK